MRLSVCSLVGFSVLPCAAGSDYTYTDPAAFGGFWEQESLLETKRPAGACFCTSSSDAPFAAFQLEVNDNLMQDPSFSGPWVHELCGRYYATLFGFTQIAPDTGYASMHGTGCAAGLAAMAIVCAQSALLRSRGSAWRWHDAVVEDEGPSVGDSLGRIALNDCVRKCERNADCGSFAHGPHGCHLKGRCSASSDVLAPLGSHGEGYRTYYLESCPLPEDGGEIMQKNAAPSKRELDTQATSILDEFGLLVDMALQLVEKAAHCLATSAWPFSAAELVENRLRLAEIALGAGGVSGAHAELKAFEWSRRQAPPVTSASRGKAIVAVEDTGSDPDGPVRRALERSRLRWVRKLNSEVGFWHVLLTPPSSTDDAENLERSEEDAATARHWLDTGEVRWIWDEETLCDMVTEARTKVNSRYGPPRILNAGSGPLAPGPETCSGLGAVPVQSADGLGRYYLQLYDLLELRPPRSPAHCLVEELRDCFPRNHFDVVHIRNALDHSVDPLFGIRQMLDVARPGSWVLLRHAQNEGLPGQFQVGLHQWAFDATPGADGALHFMIWGPALRADVTTWLLESGLASEVKTELRPHPGQTESGADGDYIWVDIRKPLEAATSELARDSL